MNKIMNAVIGDPKTASPAKKYAAYALLGTAVAFLLALVILIGSSIAFAVADGGSQDAAPSGDASGDIGGTTVSKAGAVTYETISADELDAKVNNTLVDVQEKRTAMENADGKKYYDAYRGHKLTSDAQKAVDSMLIAYYGATQDNNIFIGAKGCGDELYDSGLVVGIAKSDEATYLQSTPIDSTNHSWIFQNAYKYGFVQLSTKDAEQAHVFRYVGVAAATYMKNNAKNVANYEAFVNVLKTNTKVNTSVTVDKVSYQMYYLAADAELKVPTNYEYTVIADGTNGYIVTVNMSKKIQAETTDTDGGVG